MNDTLEDLQTMEELDPLGRVIVLVAEQEEATAREALVQLQTIERMADLLDEHPRAKKLMEQGKHFIVIASHEPYYLRAYAMIRAQETEQGSWTKEDERLYLEAVSA